MKTLIIASTLLVSACAPGFDFMSTGSNGVAEYEWVGCHKVTNSPSSDGSVAFGPFGLDTKFTGGNTYFKQKSKDGTVGKVTTGDPC